MTYPITRRLGAGLLACAAASLAHATENGQISYPVGVNTVLNGLLPPPGATQFFNYSIYYSADRFAGPHGGSAVPGFRLDVVAETPRIVHTWERGLGPFTISSSAIVPIQRARLSTPAGTGARTALGDVILEPFMLGYASPAKDFHAFFSPSFAVPTGAYSSSRIANTGLNTYAFLPYLSMSWFPSPRWEVSATTLIEANTRNRATGYQSGSVAVLDYLVLRRQPAPAAGRAGHIAQAVHRRQEGRRQGRRGRLSRPGGGHWSAAALHVGPASGIAVKYQHEFAVRNRPQGGKLWVQFSFPI